MAADGILALKPGALFFDRYRVVRRIKSGGMGSVYEAVDERTDSPRALKIMLPSMLADGDMRARFTLEAKVTGSIKSDHLVRVSDAGIDEATETPFLVMELLHGEELGSLLAKRGPLPAGEVVLYLHQAALALDKTHAAGIVHRDLKPENLFVTYRDDGSPCVKILDFGIAKVVAQNTAHMTRAVGTPIYMAPEQIRGEASIGAATDLFALGHIAYALLAGEAYWYEDMKSVEAVYPLLMRIMGGTPEAPTAKARRRRGVVLPAAFDAWFAHAVAGRPQDRFDRASTLVAALADALGVAAPQVSAITGPLSVSGRFAASAPVSTGPSGSGSGPSSGGTIVMPPTGGGPAPGAVSGTPSWSSAPTGTPSWSSAPTGMASWPPAPTGTPSSPGAASATPSAPVAPSGAPSWPAPGSGAQPAGTGVAVLSTPAPLPRARPVLPLAVGALVVAALGLGGFFAMRSPASPPAPSSEAAAQRPPTAAVTPTPPERVVPPAERPEAVTPPAPEPTATATATATAGTASTPAAVRSPPALKGGPRPPADTAKAAPPSKPAPRYATPD